MARNKNKRIYRREQQIPYSSQDPTLWANSFFKNFGFTLCNSRYYADMFIWAWDQPFAEPLLCCDSLQHRVNYTVHGILQARRLEGVAFPFSRGSSQPRDWTQVSRIVGDYQVSHKGSPRILEWVAYPFSSGSSWPRNQTRISCTAGRFFTNWAMREAPTMYQALLKPCHTK